MKVAKLLITIGLAAAALVLVFLIGKGEEQVVATFERPARLLQVTTSVTVYLPLIARNHLPGYVSPFGFISYGNVDDTVGLQ